MILDLARAGRDHVEKILERKAELESGDLYNAVNQVFADLKQELEGTETHREVRTLATDLLNDILPEEP